MQRTTRARRRSATARIVACVASPSGPVRRAVRAECATSVFLLGTLLFRPKQDQGENDRGEGDGRHDQAERVDRRDQSTTFTPPVDETEVPCAARSASRPLPIRWRTGSSG